MAWRKTIGQFVIYLPLIGLLALAIYSLCIGATTSDDGIERDIRIWKDALILSAIIGEIGSLIVVRQFNILLTGTTPNFIQDLQEENSQDFAIIYNGIVATVYKGNIIKNLIMDCQSYTKYRPNETTGGIFVSWRRKEELPTGA